MIRILLGLVVFGAVSPVRAGAWLQEPGKAYLRLSGGWLETQDRYDPDGERVPFDDFGGFRETTYRDLESILYAEVGMHPRLTLLTTFMFKSVRASQPAVHYQTRGAADFMVGAKTKIWKGLWHVGSASAEWWFPTGYDETRYPSLGSGRGEVRLTLQAGASVGKAWANADAGVGLRSSPFRDRFLGLLSGGYSMSSDWALRGSLGWIEPLGEVSPDDRPDPSAAFDPATVDTRALEASGVLSYKLGVWAVEAEVRGPLWGENTLAGTRFSLAVATGSSVRLWGEEPPPPVWGVQP